MSEAEHWTSHDALKYGVRRCQIIADRGRNFTVEIDRQIVTIPRNSVFPTAHQALDEAHRQKRLECVRALRYWAGRLRQQIEVIECQ
jgi:hypothetical protein